MATYILYAVVRVKVESDLEDVESVIDEFEQNANYEFENTPNVEVTETEWIETKTTEP